MKLRTGHGPKDWSDNIPGARGRVSGFEPKSGTRGFSYSVGGELVDGESAEERSRRLSREATRRDRAKAVQS